MMWSALNLLRTKSSNWLVWIPTSQKGG